MEVPLKQAFFRHRREPAAYTLSVGAGPVHALQGGTAGEILLLEAHGQAIR